MDEHEQFYRKVMSDYRIKLIKNKILIDRLIRENEWNQVAITVMEMALRLRGDHV